MDGFSQNGWFPIRTPGVKYMNVRGNKFISIKYSIVPEKHFGKKTKMKKHISD